LSSEATLLDQIENIKLQLEKSPKNPELLNDLGVGYYLLGEYEESISELKKAVSEDPENKTYVFNLANSCSEAEQFDRAIPLYHDVIEKDPEHIPSFNNLADCYEAIGDLEKAQELFEYITNIAPDNALSHFNLGNFKLRNNNHIDAAKCYQKAIECEPGFIDAYYNIAWILTEVKAFENALEFIDQGLAIDPDHDDLKELRSKISNKLG
jgi:tetratricopeptide (TPR) repeat protein